MSRPPAPTDPSPSAAESGPGQSRNGHETPCESGRFPTALITGASPGIGAAFARRLAQQGSALILTARRKDRLEALAELLQHEYHIQVEVLDADLASPDGVNAAAQRLTAAPVDLLVNNAGLGIYRPLADTSEAKLMSRLQPNVVALARLTHAALPEMIRRGSGTVINVASGLAFNPSATRATPTNWTALTIQP
ncbi:SDR family NAD(P)-dependent oxidoreductase [Deinococcus sp. Arct2-2]|uniref:SDR family NAD(P)-dependent oxidoreductase n=1 Tax=Deinococcus sp. Arct2-2 TaxID=2568653 RepID=UPI0010A3A490|nr:SDR family NAD(P)-dependent oxidoreductase [Deinococcus sp. Arct2-2]THF67727.1 SDR family NAD(P)-dependent oxidoreductase [Deinococcus sp. Arct2-2]